MLNARVNSATLAKHRSRPWTRDRLTVNQAEAQARPEQSSHQPRCRSRCVRLACLYPCPCLRLCVCVCVELPSPLGKFSDRLQTWGRNADAPRRLPPIWVLSTAAICSYLWTTWEAVAVAVAWFLWQTRSPSPPISLSLASFPLPLCVLITTKNNDRLRLLEAIWRNKNFG